MITKSKVQYYRCYSMCLLGTLALLLGSCELKGESKLLEGEQTKRELKLSPEEVKKEKETDEGAKLLLEESKRFVFIRHGITPWEVTMIVHGPQDLSLSEQGRRHIQSMSEKLSETNINPQKILTSTLIRCLETTAIIEEELGKRNKIPSIIREEHLKEIYHGNWSLERKEKVEQIVKEQQLKVQSEEIDELEAKRNIFKQIGELDRPDDAEKWEHFRERIKILDHILATEPNDTIIISHGMVIKEYLKYKGVFKEIERTWVGDEREALIITRFPDGSLKVECFTGS